MILNVNRYVALMKPTSRERMKVVSKLQILSQVWLTLTDKPVRYGYVVFYEEMFSCELISCIAINAAARAVFLAWVARWCN